ncbi:MAG: T9SS type A sorting domain-containing protein [Bacteroidetes bacterium]|nr:T9SS type A sorting domain-containing protein [Bacteroidota bacterium]
MKTKLSYLLKVCFLFLFVFFFKGNGSAQTLDFCKSIQLLKDTVEVDVAKDETDLKFTISGDLKPYPNYLFESFDDRLIIDEGFNQTYIFSGDNCIGDDCAEFTPFHFGVDFKSNISETVYVKGRFSIGYLNGNTCPFDVVYLLSPANSLSLEMMNESNFSIFPNPVVDILRVSEDSNSFYVLINMHGDEIQNGVVGDSINMEKVPSGLYFLKINNKINKIVKQ